MKRLNLSVSEKDIIDLYKRGDDRTREILRTVFPNENFAFLETPITERIKDLDDASECVGYMNVISYGYENAVDAYKGESKAVDAFAKLLIVCKALNSESPLQKHTSGYCKLFYPIFQLTADGKKLVYQGDVTDGTSDIMDCRPFPLGLHTEELARYCGRQFLDLWEDYMIYKK